MEADWDEITRIAVPSSGLHAIPSPASAIAFDDLQELLWVGNDQVSVARRVLVLVLVLLTCAQGPDHFVLWS
jgi:hypothetical protein